MVIGVMIIIIKRNNYFYFISKIKMSSAFQQIFNDTMENSPVDVILPTLPDINNINITNQIKILYHSVQ